MLKRKKKEAIATTRLNAYVSEELGRPGKYSENEVSNKLDSVIVKVNVESAASTGCPPSQDSSSPYFSRGGTRLSPTSRAAQNRRGARMERTASWNGGRTNANWDCKRNRARRLLRQACWRRTANELPRRRFLRCPRATRCRNSENR